MERKATSDHISISTFAAGCTISIWPRSPIIKAAERVGEAGEKTHAFRLGKRRDESIGPECGSAIHRYDVDVEGVGERAKLPDGKPKRREARRDRVASMIFGSKNP